MKKIFIMLLVLCSVFTGFTQQTINLTGWKFHAGDDAEWAQPECNDSGWKPIQAGKVWEEQGYKEVDGYAWYRVRFHLPSGLKQDQVTGVLRFALGCIDDCDQTFLNGKPIGQNVANVSTGSTLMVKDMATLPAMFTLDRNYVLSFNDPRLKWDAENVLAVRVYDIGGAGGLSSAPLRVVLGKLNDYVVFDYQSQMPESRPNGVVRKIVRIKNLVKNMPVKGKLTVTVTNAETRKPVGQETRDITVGVTEQALCFDFRGSLSKRLQATYTFVPDNGQEEFHCSEEFPYILTPVRDGKPRINGASVVGVHPGSSFLFRVPVTGNTPLKISVSDLPDGLVFDAGRRVIHGRVSNAGTYHVRVCVSNANGTATRTLRIVVGNRIALTPPMGWNSWNCFGLQVDEEKAKAAADAFISFGLADHGWTYVNLDDGWEAPQRDGDGKVQSNAKFNDMKALTDYIHDYGLKAGIYSSPGPKTCGNFLGSYQYEESDVQTYADWGFDYLKYDWCSYDLIAKDHSLSECKKPYQVMRDALQKTGHDILFSLCQYGMGDVWTWGNEVGGNTWRTTGDIVDTWESMSGIGFHQEAGAPYAKPGCWNDPDMLVVGWVGWGVLHPTRLTPSEQYTHISLWCMLSAPLLIGCDLTKLDAFTLNLLTNDEIIAIDQDPLGKQGIAVIKDPAYQIMVKDLEDGSKAVALFNLSESDLKITAPFDKLGLNGKQNLRDLWRQKDLGVFTDKFETTVPSHGVVMVRAEIKNINGYLKIPKVRR